jgi:hypothetical protein
MVLREISVQTVTTSSSLPSDPGNSLETKVKELNGINLETNVIGLQAATHDIIGVEVA